MGNWHIDEDCDAAFIRLNDALCSFERSTGRGYVLMLIPENNDEKIQISLNGKSLPADLKADPEKILQTALAHRKKQI